MDNDAAIIRKLKPSQGVKKPINQPQEVKKPSNKSRMYMPTEVTIGWIYKLQQKLVQDGRNLDSRQREKIKTILDAQKLRWMQHGLTVERTRKTLESDIKSLQQVGGGDDLIERANYFLDNLPFSGRASYEETKKLLRDNAYGNMFESAWMKALVKSPILSKPLFNTMQSMKDSLKRMYVNMIYLDTKRHFIHRLQHFLFNDNRYWFSEYEPNYRKFASMRGKNHLFLEAEKCLNLILTREITDGYGVIFTAFLVQKSFSSYREVINREVKRFHIQEPRWMAQNQGNFAVNLPGNSHGIGYYQKTNGLRMDIQDTKNLVNNLGKDALQHSGTNKVFQKAPANPRWKGKEFIWINPGEYREPLYEGKITQTELLHGIPHVGGVSGTTNIIMAMVSYFQKDLKRVDINPLQAALATMMFVVYDGGHSMHEVLWILYERHKQGKDYVSFKWNLAGPRPSGDPSLDNFVSDFNYFVSLFKGETRKSLNASLKIAWKETLDYYHDTHYYAIDHVNDQPTWPDGPKYRKKVK